MAKGADVNVSIYNSMGQLLSHQKNPNLSAGQHSLIINASNLLSGIYTYVLVIDKQYRFFGQMTILHL
jgi:hypothetical protein